MSGDARTAVPGLAARRLPPQWWPGPQAAARAAAAVSVGRWLGLAFAVCMVTGVFVTTTSTRWGGTAADPSGLGLPGDAGSACHGRARRDPVAAGQAVDGVPALVLMAAGPDGRPDLERLSIAVLVAGAVFELATGLLNILQWYPWPFGFIQAHWWVAWLTVGALLVHLAVKAPLIAAHWRTRRAPAPPPRPGEDVAVSRRTVLLAAGTAAAAVTVVTAGQNVPWLRRRRPGPRAAWPGRGRPADQPTAAAAGVEQTAVDPTWALQIGGRTPSALGLADLAGLPQQTSRLPISCVEGWSATASWTGVRLRDVLAAAGVPAGTDVRLVSLEPHGSNHTSLLPAAFADDPLTLLALQLDGATLSLDHGYPCRLIGVGPARRGADQVAGPARAGDWMMRALRRRRAPRGRS